MLNLTTPLRQFDIYIIVNLNMFDNSLWYVNNSNLVVFCGFSFFFFTFFLLSKKIKMVPNKIQFYLECIYIFLFQMVNDQLSSKGRKFFPFLLFTFISIILLNVIGLLPFGFAVTSHFVWGLFMSLSICLGIFFVGLSNHGFDYFKIFILDIPLLLYPLMTVIELASYVIRAFSLAIRLCANIMAGHILVDIISEVVSFLNFQFIDFVFVLFFILLALFLLEIGVAFLQAYVFVLLTLLYLRDAIILPSH